MTILIMHALNVIQCGVAKSIKVESYVKVTFNNFFFFPVNDEHYANDNTHNRLRHIIPFRCKLAQEEFLPKLSSYGRKVSEEKVEM